MKVFLDESVPVQVRFALSGHEVVTATWLGWKGISNGKLLEAAERAGFDVLIIADKSLRHQQNLARRRIGIIELWTNHRPTLEKNFRRIAEAVEKIEQGKYVVVQSS